jgi:hypothetical protein
MKIKNIKSKCFGPHCWVMLETLAYETDSLCNVEVNRHFESFLTQLYIPCKHCRSSYPEYLMAVMQDMSTLYTQKIHKLHDMVNSKLNKPKYHGEKKYRSIYDVGFWDSVLRFFAYSSMVMDFRKYNVFKKQLLSFLQLLQSMGDDMSYHLRKIWTENYKHLRTNVDFLKFVWKWQCVYKNKFDRVVWKSEVDLHEDVLRCSVQKYPILERSKLTGYSMLFVYTGVGVNDFFTAYTTSKSSTITFLNRISKKNRLPWYQLRTRAISRILKDFDYGIIDITRLLCWGYIHENTSDMLVYLESLLNFEEKK